MATQWALPLLLFAIWMVVANTSSVQGIGPTDMVGQIPGGLMPGGVPDGAPGDLQGGMPTDVLPSGFPLPTGPGAKHVVDDLHPLDGDPASREVPKVFQQQPGNFYTLPKEDEYATPLAPWEMNPSLPKEDEYATPLAPWETSDTLPKGDPLVPMFLQTGQQESINLSMDAGPLADGVPQYDINPFFMPWDPPYDYNPYMRYSHPYETRNYPDNVQFPFAFLQTSTAATTGTDTAFQFDGDAPAVPDLMDEAVGDSGVVDSDRDYCPEADGPPLTEDGATDGDMLMQGEQDLGVNKYLGGQGMGRFDTDEGGDDPTPLPSEFVGPDFLGLGSETYPAPFGVHPPRYDPRIPPFDNLYGFPPEYLVAHRGFINMNTAGPDWHHETPFMLQAPLPAPYLNNFYQPTVHFHPHARSWVNPGAPLGFAPLVLLQTQYQYDPEDPCMQKGGWLHWDFGGSSCSRGFGAPFTHCVSNGLRIICGWACCLPFALNPYNQGIPDERKLIPFYAHVVEASKRRFQCDRPMATPFAVYGPDGNPVKHTVLPQPLPDSLMVLHDSCNFPGPRNYLHPGPQEPVTRQSPAPCSLCCGPPKPLDCGPPKQRKAEVGMSTAPEILLQTTTAATNPAPENVVPGTLMGDDYGDYPSWDPHRFDWASHYGPYDHRRLHGNPYHPWSPYGVPWTPASHPPLTSHFPAGWGGSSIGPGYLSPYAPCTRGHSGPTPFSFLQTGQAAGMPGGCAENDGGDPWAGIADMAHKPQWDLSWDAYDAYRRQHNPFEPWPSNEPHGATLWAPTTVGSVPAAPGLMGQSFLETESAVPVDNDRNPWANALMPPYYHNYGYDMYSSLSGSAQPGLRFPADLHLEGGAYDPPIPPRPPESFAPPPRDTFYRGDLPQWALYNNAFDPYREIRKVQE
eukprot:TRINITY_DN143_c0_g1_i2.p1 TRINITY_DN143_c0_g1~~TRINITY_DN143_c0_g1_i2.p1  ORF type:complete len:925 (-),score=139.40 TRINITY_DN143_c0_g1_i2:33-2753(-)